MANGYNERSIHNLTESNKTLADANKILAEANRLISKNNDELIQLTKLVLSSGSKQIVFPTPDPIDKSKEVPSVQGDLDLGKKYSRDKRLTKDK